MKTITGWWLGEGKNDFEGWFVYSPEFDYTPMPYSYRRTKPPGLPNKHFYAKLAEHKLTNCAGLVRGMDFFVYHDDCVYTKEKLPLD